MLVFPLASRPATLPNEMTGISGPKCPASDVEVSMMRTPANLLRSREQGWVERHQLW
jgi:hypothetical protein